jgi:hypothetical protein
MRGDGMNFQDALSTFQTATQTASRNPREALPLAREALHGFRWSCHCMRIRTGCLVGVIFSDLLRLERSERVFSILYRLADGCACCQPVIDRHFSILLSRQKRHPEAVAKAEAALAAVREDSIYISTLAYVCYYARDPRAAGLFTDALENFPPGSAPHRVALFNLAFALTFCEDKGKNLARVETLLPEIRERYKDVRDASAERGYLKWLDGGVHAAKAETLKGWPRRTALCKSRDSLMSGYILFQRLELPEANIVWLDLLAVLAHININRRKIATTLEKGGNDLAPPSSFDMLAFLAKDTREELFHTLRTLRNSFEGCPLVSYA